MTESSLLRELGQVSKTEVGEVFREFLRGSIVKMACEVMTAEVAELCGPKHSPSDCRTYRAGSAAGRILVEGERESVTRPRVRERPGAGGSREVELLSYAAANDPEQLEKAVIQALMSGVSTRQMSVVKPKSPGVSRSSVYGKRREHD
ncbi:hypothetical protein [Aureliella helgolandensis]|uniref:Transposase, Mutator family n=1 Tax=Aureliella helgolandensis TaxID=2527968 RepID=A0A518GAZ3_9BACT|nr:hypothetical protein [Aureliella helgolandensis]QDV25764.1 hypothetical protein Q31a_40910 [Aureliella helgolandensis]